MEQEKENNRHLEDDVELVRVQHELEVERMKRTEWEAALEKHEVAKEQAQEEHNKSMAQIEQAHKTSGAAENPSSQLAQGTDGKNGSHSTG